MTPPADLDLPNGTAGVPDVVPPAHETGGDGDRATRRRVAIVLPYAVAIRDFVHNGVLTRLQQAPNLDLVIYTVNPDLPELAEAREQGVEVRSFPAYRDSRAERALKMLYLYVFADRFAYIEQMLAAKPVKRTIAAILSAGRRAIGTARFLRLFERVMLWLHRRRGLAPILLDSPDLVVATRSLMNSIDYGVIAEAREKRIDIVTIANSWDNFTTKGFFPFRATKIIVWNRKMLAELEDIFEVPAEIVEVAGYPRRQTLHRLAQGIDPAAYLASLGHPDYKRFILYSASYSELTRVPGDAYPLEYQVMADVAARLERVLPDDVCILLRMHPFSDPGDDEIFSQLSRSFVFVPGRKDQYVERVMDLADEAHLARQIALSECVLSMASTMTIDALSLGKPVLNTRFDPRADIPFLHSNARFYAFNHFRDLVSLVDLPVADSADEVLDFVAAVLAGDHRPRGDMAAFERHYVPDASADYADTVSGLIRRLAHAAPPSLPSAADRCAPVQRETPKP